MTDTNTTIIDPEVQQLTLDMNEEIGVYFPADVTDLSEMDLYDEFFMLLRKAYFLYDLYTSEQTEQMFLEFYNSEVGDKIGMINQVTNKIEQHISNYSAVIENNPEIINERNALLYMSQPDIKSKADMLFFIANGYTPEAGDDVSQYIEVATSIEESVEDANKEIEDTLIAESEVEQSPDASPEEIVSRYLKGSGVYDPALRNTGFRVDTDIEKVNGPQV